MEKRTVLSYLAIEGPDFSSSVIRGGVIWPEFGSENSILKTSPVVKTELCCSLKARDR